MALVPFAYNTRSLWQRRGATLLTVLSISATVGVLSGMLCLQQGFTTMQTQGGRTDLAIFMRPGAESEGQSAFDLERARSSWTPTARRSPPRSPSSPSACRRPMAARPTCRCAACSRPRSPSTATT